MTALGLGFYFSLLTVTALLFICRPLSNLLTKKHIFLLPCLIIVLLLAYWRWGGWLVWREHIEQQAKQAQIKALLASIQNPAQLIEKLKKTLELHPGSARGWFLLGRIYASQTLWLEARGAFKKAYRLQPDDETIALNYAHSLWLYHNKHLNSTSRAILENLLAKNPNQADALFMLKN